MSASLPEIQELADEILARLGTRMRTGQIVIHLNDGFVQRVETNVIHKPLPAPLKKDVRTGAEKGAYSGHVIGH